MKVFSFQGKKLTRIFWTFSKDNIREIIFIPWVACDDNTNKSSIQNTEKMA